jgi:replicative DNA helicase
MSVVGQVRRRRDEPTPNDAPADADGRPPPHDLDAEKATLSSILVDPAAIDLVVGWLRIEHFYSEAHRRIYEAALDLRQRSEPTDSVAVAGWLRERSRLAQVSDGGATSGMAYLSQILLAAPHVTNVESYARIVVNHFRVRQALLVCRTYAAKAYLDHGSADEFLASLEAEVIGLGGAHEGRKAEDIGITLRQEFDDAAADQTRGRLPGIARAFPDYDAKTLGAHPGDLEVVAARPGMGKTAWAICVALNVARRVPELVGEESAYSGVLFFSVEMPRKQLAQRIFSIEAHVDLGSLRSRSLSNEQWSRLAAAGSRLQTLPFVVDDTPALEIHALRAKVRRIKAKMARPGYRNGAPTKLRLVIVDYLQLLRAVDPTIRSREQEVSFVSRSLKELAKEEDVAVMALAQLNRNLEQRSGGDKRPRPGDLRESGQVEQDADLITFIHREEMHGAQVAPGDEGKTELIIAKQRNGPTGTVFVRYRPGNTSFESW